MKMNCDRLYDWIKDCLHYSNVEWWNKKDLGVYINGEYLVASNTPSGEEFRIFVGKHPDASTKNLSEDFMK